MKKSEPRFLTVYTASVATADPLWPQAHLILGSFLRRGDAIRECVNHILLDIVRSQRVRLAAMKDEGIICALKGIKMSDDEIEGLAGPQVAGWTIPERVAGAIRDNVTDAIGGEGCFILWSDGGEFEYRVDVDENDVEGKGGLQLWTCITTGKDYGNHDPEFGDPFPEVFLSEGAAMKCALDDLRVFLEGCSKEDVAVIMKDAEESLSNNGHFEFILDQHSFMEVPEGSAPKCRRWDIWSTPLDIGNGTPKAQRVQS